MNRLRNLTYKGKKLHIYEKIYSIDRLKVFIINDGDIFLKSKDNILARMAGLKDIVLVFIPPDDRFHDYTPWEEGSFRKDYPFSGGGDEYLIYIIDKIIPLIEGELGLEILGKSTYLAGASLGGLISLYGLLEYPDDFGGAICISSSFWYDNFLDYVRTKELPSLDVPIYMDVGDREGKGRITLNRDVLEISKEVYSMLLEKGLKNISFKIQEGMSHRSNFFVDRLCSGIEYISNKKE